MAVVYENISFFFHRYAIRESSNKVKLFKNFKEKKSFKPDLGAEGINITPAHLFSWLLTMFIPDFIKEFLEVSC